MIKTDTRLAPSQGTAAGAIWVGTGVFTISVLRIPGVLVAGFGLPKMAGSPGPPNEAVIRRTLLNVKTPIRTAAMMKTASEPQRKMPVDLARENKLILVGFMVPFPALDQAYGKVLF
jgi:hypothetical protein